MNTTATSIHIHTAAAPPARAGRHPPRRSCWRRPGAVALVALAACLCLPLARADLIVAAHPNFDSTAVGQLFLLGAPGASGTVASRSGAFSEAFVLDATGMATVTVPSSQFLGPAGAVVDRALRVSGARVSGYFLNHQSGSADMSYLFEDSVLGTEYRVLAYPGLGSRPAQMSVTALHGATTVTVTPSVALSTGQAAGTPFTVALDAGQSVLYTAVQGGEDLTGSRISASQPVAVFAGAQCAQVPPGTTYCDHLYSQLPPLDRLSMHHIVPVTDHTGSVGNRVRVLAVNGGTEVSVNGAAPVLLAAGQVHEIPDADSLDIRSTQPVLVGQYLQGQGRTGGLGDPAFTVVPGADQSLGAYAFAVPSGAQAFGDNVLNIAVPTASVPSLRLNGAAVGAPFVPLAGTSYSVGHVNVPPGAGRISADAPFVATLSGFKFVTSYLTLLGASYARGVSPEPDLAVALAAPVRSATVGAALGLVATVTNVGAGNSTDGVLAMALPATLALDVASLPPACAASTPSQLRCTLGPLMPAAGQSFSVSVRALAAGSPSLRAEVSGVSGEPAAQRANNISGAVTLAFTAPPQPGGPGGGPGGPGGGPGGPGGGGPGTTGPRPVPVDSWWMLLGMAAGLGWMARRRVGPAAGARHGGR